MNGQNLLTMVNQLQSNPMQFMQKMGMSLPNNIDVKDPNAIIQYLMRSGKVSQEQYDRAVKMAQQFR